MKEKGKMRQMLMTTLLVTAGIVMIGGNVSKAALQSNSTTHASPPEKAGAVWMEEIRKMETEGQTMGLSETLNNDLSPKTSNNIDVHMMRTTEYGAIAILSASGFGNPKKLSEVTTKTTTGNVTGVYLGARWEWTAGVMSADAVGKNARYYDLYNATSASAKAGDALGMPTASNPGCTLDDGYGNYLGTWHDGSEYFWLGGDRSGFLRGCSGMFGFIGTADLEWHNFPSCVRGVAVIGQGL